jgi:hypothetical protein
MEELKLKTGDELKNEFYEYIEGKSWGTDVLWGWFTRKYNELITQNLAPKQEKKERPKIVCLCGSTRFMEAFQKANLEETIAGKIVLSIGCNTKSDRDLEVLGRLTEEAKEKLDELHKRKIDLADEVLILNVDGYIGKSTRSELNYAVEHGKQIKYLEPLPKV